MTDVYFNNNTGPLATTLGADLTVRGVNFASGASGPVTIGGANTLTIGATPVAHTFASVGGITVQNGSGAHVISANVVLGGPLSEAAPPANTAAPNDKIATHQFWGNASANTFTVTGNISGNYGLTLTNSYVIYAPSAGTAAGTDGSGSVVTQTGSGTAATTFVLSGNNTFTGGTTVSSGTLMVNNSSGSGTGTGVTNVMKGATLANNGNISGSVAVSGNAGGSGTYGNAVTVNSGGTFEGAATISGALSVNTGGLVTLSDGTLTASGGVINNGTVRLAHGASLSVGGTTLAANRVTTAKTAVRPKAGAASAAVTGGTFINNGTLDIISGEFVAPAGFTNNGVVLDSRVVQVKSVNASGGVVAVAIDGYSGHVYQLQRSGSLGGDTFTNVGTPQSGVTGVVMKFQDASPSPDRAFYRVQVDP